MPIDNNIKNRTFLELFDNKISFQIPFFQRAYSWQREQWKQLLEDIEEQIIGEVSEQIYHDVIHNKFDIHNQKDYLFEHEHYFGAIVVLEKINNDPDLKCFDVIDGQQRITTVYLLLAIIADIIENRLDKSNEEKDFLTNLKSLIVNDVKSGNDDYRKLKLNSNKGDRYPTYQRIFKENPDSELFALDLQLYNKANNQIDALWDYGFKKLKSKSNSELKIISEAILKGLKIVWIPLNSEKDDPQAIFEGLNDKGMPLSAIELLCSYIFKPLIDEKTKIHEKIHNEKWLKTIKKLGNESEFESYLRNYFSIGQRKMIGKGRRLYTHFKSTYKKLEKDDSLNHLEAISKNSDFYLMITKCEEARHKHQNEAISKKIKQINMTEMTSCYPFLLALLIENSNQKVSDNELLVILDTLLNLLVRRKICELKTTKYDVFFPDLIDKIINEPDKNKEFFSLIQKEGLFVSNQEFEESIINKPLYKQPQLEFARMVLQDIDKALQDHGQLPDYSTISTIEHILPQTLDDEWKEYLGVESKDLNLDRIKNSIGNLCLVSRQANSTVGQNPFEKKINVYTDVSSLTRDIKGRINQKWNMDAIKERSKFLSHYALQIWKWN